jgi:hypothetical protein
MTLDEVISLPPLLQPARKVKLSEDETWHGKNVVAHRHEYRIAVDRLNNATHVSAWTPDNKRIGMLSTRTTSDNVGKDYLSISRVEVDTKHRKKGIGLAMYKALLCNLSPDWKGIGSYLPDQANRRQVPKIWKRIGGHIHPNNSDHVIANRIDEKADHMQADRERFQRVLASYKDNVAKLKKYLDDPALADLKKRNPELWSSLSVYMGDLENKIASQKRYFSSFHRFKTTDHDDDMEFFFGEGLRLIKAWFAGWLMRKLKPDTEVNLLRALKVAQKLAPADDMVLYRVMSVEDYDAVSHLKQIRTGINSIQSWTTDYRSAMRFFRTQYAQGETMVVSDDGIIGSEDVAANRDFVIVKAKLPKSMIMWTSHTVDSIEDYSMHAADSKLYPHYFNIPDSIHEYAYQKEIIVYVPSNNPIAIIEMKLISKKIK